MHQVCALWRYNFGQCNRAGGLLTTIVMSTEDYINYDGRSMAQGLAADLSPRNFGFVHRSVHLDLTVVTATSRQVFTPST
jgi:hypothetical protein